MTQHLEPCPKCQGTKTVLALVDDIGPTMILCPVCQQVPDHPANTLPPQGDLGASGGLIERLREGLNYSESWDGEGEVNESEARALMEEAAAEIERLNTAFDKLAYANTVRAGELGRALDDNVRLRAALAPFAKAGGLFGVGPYFTRDACIYAPAAGKEYNLHSGHLLDAADALAANPSVDVRPRPHTHHGTNGTVWETPEGVDCPLCRIAATHSTPS